MPPPQRLEQQVRFLVELDKLKTVLRQTPLMDGSRRENDAEHSWHVALMAALLSEYAAPEEIDLLRAIKMLLIHDVVEIDAGDTYCYDEAGQRERAARERKAADRIYRLLPQDQAREWRALWDEFEARQTPESRFANAMDRFQPLLHNYITGGRSWKEHAITRTQVETRNQAIEEGAPALWAYTLELVRRAVERGQLAGT